MSRPTDWWVLDLSSDPTPGDPERIWGLSARLTSIGDEAEALEQQVRGLAADNAVLTWIGAAGDAFRPAIGQFPGQLGKVARSHHMAGAALRTYAAGLDSAQSQADRALALGRTAQSRFASLQSQLTSAQSGLAAATSSAQSLQHPAQGAPKPDPAQVQAAVRNQVAAQSHVSQLSGKVAGAQSQLDLAKKLAGQAADLRSQVAGTCAIWVNEASDAGIHPDSFWQKLGEIAGQVWHYLVIAAKVVVAVGGIIALIIGGPIAWVVFAAALIVLADTLYKYAKGKASLWDVALALVSCIPMTRGITSLGELATAFREGSEDAGLVGGLLGAGGHIVAAARTTAVETVIGFWRGVRAIPRLIQVAPFTAAGKVTLMAAELRDVAGGSLTGFVCGLGDGDGIIGTVREGASGLVGGWKSGLASFQDALSGSDPALSATKWQSGLEYPGKDGWSNTTLSAGTNVEVLHPGISGFTTPEGVAASLGHDATQINQGIQVGGRDIVGDIKHSYRPEVVILRLNTDMAVATSVTHANPQYGAGGIRQYFIPHIVDAIKTGSINVIGADGSNLETEIVGNAVKVEYGDGQMVQLHNLDLPAATKVFTQDQFGAGVTSLDNIRMVTTATAREYSSTSG